jgi:hypothetical protein
MPATLKTRKPVDKLTVGDLVAFPIWEFASDEESVEGQDETWVRPRTVQKLAQGSTLGKALARLGARAPIFGS